MQIESPVDKSLCCFNQNGTKCLRFFGTNIGPRTPRMGGVWLKLHHVGLVE
jgi:hypothetical protein